MKNLGAAEIIVSIDSNDGIVIRHGSDRKIILASKSAEDCTREDWDALWDAFEKLGTQWTLDL